MNILHIISDQHIAECMGFAGHPQAITPNLDRLAAMGVHCTNAYTNNPICTPSRTTVLSGQYCHNHGYYGLSGPTPQSLPTWLGQCRAFEYRTAAIGKLHLPNDPVDWLIHNGDVDFWADCYRDPAPAPPGEGINAKFRSPYYRYLTEHGLIEKEDSGRLWHHDGGQNPYFSKPSDLPFEHCVEKWCVDEAIAFIDGERGDNDDLWGDVPFAMQVSLPRPHQLYTPDQRFWDMYDDDLDLPRTLDQDHSGRAPHFQKMAEWFREKGTDGWPIDVDSWEQGARRVWKGYLACITQVDHCIGLLLDALDQRDLLDDTAVLYHADHGAYSTHFGLPEKAPGICSDMVCRIPMIWHIPGITDGDRAGSAVDGLIENADIAATLCAAADIDEMDSVDGIDALDLLAGDVDAIKDVAVTENPWSKSIRFGDWRYVHYVDGTFKGFDQFGDVPTRLGELYNLADDPDETRNLYGDPAHRDVQADAERRLLDWLIETTRHITHHPAGATGQDADGKRRVHRNAAGGADVRQTNYL